MKEDASGICGSFSHFLQSDATNVCYFLSNDGNIGTLVTLAAIWHRRKIRSIGLQQYSIQRHSLGHLGKSGILECDHATNADIETHFHGSLGFLHAAAKTVHHATILSEIQVTQKAKQLIIGFAHMETHGQIELASPLHLTDEHFALLLIKGLVPIEVKSNFSHTNEMLVGGKQFLLNNCQLLLEILIDRGGVQPHHLAEILDWCMLSGIDGIVAGNASRNIDLLELEEGKKTRFRNAAISGAPLFPKSLELVKFINKHTKGRFPIIGVGGIMTPSQAKEMLDAGASLIEMYTGFVYEGPKIVKKTLKALSPSD